MNPGEAPIAEMRAALDKEFDVLLLPVSHPSLGPIRIVDDLFAIGRSEAPFADYPRDRVIRLSRRHARIFSEHGAVYVADLDSKNGTTVNGVAVRMTPSRVRAGDELCFGGDLTYRVAIEPRPFSSASARGVQHLTVTLKPERADLGLEPIDLIGFPFLVSKTDELFSRYKDRYPHQVNYISRRHAHIFMKGGEPWIEDLGSTNGTFLNLKRLGESAVALQNGDIVGFGGDHFVYQVALQKSFEIEPTVTQMVPPAATLGVPAAAAAPAAAAPATAAPAPAAAAPVAAMPAEDPDKTTFVGAAHSFLDIFCVDRALQREDEVNENAPPLTPDEGTEVQTRRPRRRWQLLLRELTRTFAAGDRTTMRRVGWGGLVVLVVVAGLAVTLYMRGAAERDIKSLLAAGEYEAAAEVGTSSLQRHPASDPIRALASEALMKARVPGWLSALQVKQFDRAAALIEGMRATSQNNPDALALINQLKWVGDLERFVVGRGGPDAPIRIYSDEGRIDNLLKRWEDDAKRHQRILDRIASYVPEFTEPYALAMSHLRKLQSDDSVYLAAIDRLNATIATELGRDKPDALPVVLDDYAQRYPRLAGLDSLRSDLRQYTDIYNEMTARRLVPLLALMKKASFRTPPFKSQYAQLSASRLPSAEVVAKHDAASAAWQSGDSQQALAGLQAIPAGPWSDVIAAEFAHKKALLDQFADLQKSRGAGDRDDKLLSFYASLDPVEDTYFVRAVQGDVNALRDKALARAQDQINRAQGLWQQYRANGSIGGTQRLESGISGGFRSQALLLSGANTAAQQGMRVYTQLKAPHPAGSDQLLEDIEAETQLQRRSLQELRMVLEPGLLKSKLALIGGSDESEARQSP
ncbi:FHA domain-containing protein [Burkholderia sp. YR290]|jgi:pSer/pThr/pTyr-binding forkhead associated (FHA) protein|uniref:FHA domain-containing protein n=1 Tax=Paraburkholderia hospita TaxID=169430 RepID=UPI0009A84D88|nr:FHA domain-containing protein [Paraburkholderia hospita]SKC85900.1 FHA domain-containing protein [Paraburkholderia hospita]SOE84670.1 FHA domain-containing protein [Burkholderia sp. YR290]